MSRIQEIRLQMERVEMQLSEGVKACKKGSEAYSAVFTAFNQFKSLQTIVNCELQNVKAAETCGDSRSDDYALA